MNDLDRQKVSSILDLWRHNLTPEVKAAFADHSHIASEKDETKQDVKEDE